MNETWWITEEDLDDDQYKIIELPPDGNFLVTGMGSLAQHTEVYKLRHHYRNGLMICRFADALARENSGYDPMENSAAYDESARPSSVESFAVESDLEQVNLIATRVLLQMQAYPQELLGVLVPLKPDADRLWELLRHSPIRDVVCYGADEGMLKGTDANIVLLSNIHDAKGLEFRAVHIASAEGFKKFPKSRNLASTGAASK